MFSDLEWRDLEFRLRQLYLSGKLCGWWKNPLGGPYLREFEKAFADYVGTEYAIGVSSGSASIYVALRACIGEVGGFVAVSPYTHIGSVAPILLAKSTPLFVDVDEFGNIEPRDLKRRCGLATYGVIVPHQLGQPSKMDEILEVIPEGVPIIEDASQSLGADCMGRKVGAIGDVGCFSIGGDMTKTLSTGEGGMIVTSNGEIAERCRKLRNHGEKSGADYLCFNFRMSDLQALIGLIQMSKLQFQIDWQIRNAEYLISKLPAYLTVPKPLAHSKPCYYILGCRFKHEKALIWREEWLKRVREKGFEGGQPRRNIGPGYQTLIYEIPYYKKFYRKCPNAERLRDEAIWLDYHRWPRTKEEIDELLNCFKEIV